MKYVIWMFAIRKWCMMRFDFKALSDSCECGKEHKLDVRDIYLEPGALDRLPGVLSENQWNSPAILADENTWKAAGEKAYSLLEAEQIKCTSVILPPDGLHADEHGVALAEKDIARETDVLLAVEAELYTTLQDTLRINVDYRSFLFQQPQVLMDSSQQ